jgi:uncharacterized protein
LTTLTQPSATRSIRPNIGLYADEQAALDAVVARLVAELDPKTIWLFGSRARGDHRPDSDFDLLVVAKADHWFGNLDSDGYDEVYKPLRTTGVGCDVVPYDTELFEVGQQLATSFIKRIVDEGREVYRA